MNSTPPISVSGSRYRPILALGRGGMAEVYLAVGQGAAGFSKLLVLKVLRAELAPDQEMHRLFLVEAQLSARLNHPNVVQVYEIVDGTRPCIVMEYLEGQPLSSIHHVAGAEFTTEMQLRVISDALAGLHYSHELRDYDGSPLEIVHRDVSPQNIFVTYDGAVKVLDFGIAKATSSAGTTTSGVFKGKVRYMPREQMLGERVDRRADLYAVGCLLWQAATHCRLWENLPESAIIRRIVAGEVPRPSSIACVDPRLERIVVKALAPEPQDRFPTALALRTAIDEYLSHTRSDCTMRDVAAFVSQRFADERETRARMIHAALSATNAPSTPRLVASALFSATPIASSATVPSGLFVATKTILTRRGRPWLAVAGVGAVVLAAGVYGGTRFLHPATPNTPENATLAPRPIEVRIDVLPREATVRFDRERVLDNPGVLRLAPDELTHELRVELAGYAPIVRMLRIERDLSLEIVLDKVLPPAADEKSNTREAPAAKAPRPEMRPGVRPVVRDPRPKTKPNGCDPPFVFQNGVKTYKPQCL